MFPGFKSSENELIEVTESNVEVVSDARDESMLVMDEDVNSDGNVDQGEDWDQEGELNENNSDGEMNEVLNQSEGDNAIEQAQTNLLRDYVSFNKVENYIYTFVYDLHKVGYVQEKGKRFPNVTTGLFHGFEFIMICLMYIQCVSLILLPSLAWSKQTKRVLLVLSFFRTLSVQSVFLDPVNGVDQVSQTTGEVMNYYFPFGLSVMYSLLLIVSLVLGMCLRYRFFLKVIHYLSLILPGVYIPVLQGFFNTFTCELNSDVRLETSPQHCFDLVHFPFAIVSFVMIFPFCIAALFLVATHYDWRPNSRRLLAKPHTRFEFVSFLLITILVTFTAMFESYPLFLLFMDFVIILIMVGLHLYFLAWYRTAINQVVCSFLLFLMSACMMATFVALFRLLFPFLEYSFTNFPGMLLATSIMGSIMIGTLLVSLRLGFLTFTLNPLQTPRLLQLVYSLEPDDIIVPRGKFEVEMVSRAIPCVSQVFQQDQAQDLTGRQQVMHQDFETKILEMYRDAIDVGAHSDCPYVHLSYATFTAHIAQDFHRAIAILSNAEADMKVLWPDFRMMLFMRKKFWRDRWTEQTEENVESVASVED